MNVRWTSSGRVGGSQSVTSIILISGALATSTRTTSRLLLKASVWSSCRNGTSPQASCRESLATSWSRRPPFALPRRWGRGSCFAFDHQYGPWGRSPTGNGSLAGRRSSPQTGLGASGDSSSTRQRLCTAQIRSGFHPVVGGEDSSSGRARS